MVCKLSSEDVVKFLDVYEECEGLWNIRHSDYNKIKSESAMLKLMGEILKRNVAVESVEGLRKKTKNIKNVYRQELTKIQNPPKVEQDLTMFTNLNLCPIQQSYDYQVRWYFIYKVYICISNSKAVG
jgi:hypothetical protein